ncbi:aminoglycoside phosphotransferase family protein [Actinopolymorpha alba]|uniref:aminoglycoside phosphotransferase family protein n=1 Tax=Actinopolymorpha alba TaxID=533267 RepID=UPI00037DDAEF|nr:aminoglycoside phosphotransferase family protein [Actinopolymorpha alba]
MNAGPVSVWLQERWPAYIWSNATVREACFHEVAILAPDVVGRVSCHGEQPERVHREHQVLSALEGVTLPYALPHNLSGVVTAGGRTGMLTTYVAGGNGDDASWDDVVRSIETVLSALWAVDKAGVQTLPPPRSWCGGAAWPGIVADRLLPRLPLDLRPLARDVVSSVVEQEKDGGQYFVHGDFGPHNLRWKGTRVVGIIDLDHACMGDPAIDLAALISFFGADQVGQIVDSRTLDRAMIHRASLTLQLAAAAELVGDAGLAAHALRNFIARSRAGTLHDPGGRRPVGGRG